MHILYISIETTHTHSLPQSMKRTVTCNITLFSNDLESFGHESIFILFASFIGLVDLFIGIMIETKITLCSNLFVIVGVVVVVRRGTRVLSTRTFPLLNN